jgi:hypothetical protein
MAYTWMNYAGIAKNVLGRWDEAAPWFRRAIEANRNFPHPHFVMGAALAQLGQLDEAHSAVKAGLIPRLSDQNSWAQSRIPMEMMRHG